jgi:hypothetical protein
MAGARGFGDGPGGSEESGGGERDSN